MIPRRVLLLSGSIGGGHDAAARAVEERIRARWPAAEVITADTLEGMGRGVGPAFAGVYAACLRHAGWLYELYFRLLWRCPPFRAGTRAVIGRWSGRGVARLLARHRPDLVVTTFPEGATGLARLRRRGCPGARAVRMVSLVNDAAPHPLWCDAALDLHLVATEEAATVARRAAPGARVAVTGPPVVSAFTPPPQGDRAGRARPLAYVAGGSLALGDVVAVVAAVLDGGADVVVTAGRHRATGRRLDRLARAHPRGNRMWLRDWVDDPAAVTAGCDLVVATGPGATAHEALACARPLLFASPVPGHGRAGAEVLVRGGLARTCPTAASLREAVAELTDPAVRAAWGKRLRALPAPADLAGALAGLPGPPEPVAVRTSRVRPEDVLFLHASTARVPQQVGARLVIEDPHRHPDWPAHVAGLVRDRGPDIELLCRRLEAPRFGRPPRWRHAAPAPDRHVHPTVLSLGEGPDAATTAFFAEAVDPVEVGWEVALARPGDGRGEIVLLARVHHALGDGLAVTDALIRLLTDESAPAASPAPAPVPGPAPAPGPAPTPGPSPLDPPGATRPRSTGWARLTGRARATGRVVRGVASLAVAGTAGPSPLTGPGAGPAALRVTASLDGRRVRRAARARGVPTTVLLLAVVAEALGAYLTETGHPDAARRGVAAMVPVTGRTRAGTESRAPGNRTAALSIRLPTAPMGPGARCAGIARALAESTRRGQPEASAAVLALFGRLPGPVRRRAARMVYGSRFAHLLSSVMPGSRRPLHVRGGLVREVHPVLPLAEGIGLAVGVLNWGRTTSVGLTADPVTIPDARGLPARLESALGVMEDGGSSG